jgi:hypothetical protein
MAGGLRFTDEQRSAFHNWLDDCCTLKEDDFKPRCESLAAAEVFEPEEWWQLIQGLAPFGAKNLWRPILLRNVELESFLLHGFDSKRTSPKKAADATKTPPHSKPPIPGKEPVPSPNLEPEEETEPDAENKPADPALATGRFLTKNSQPRKISATWRDLARVRREWHPGNIYTLELDVRRKSLESGFSYYFVVLNSWKMPAVPSPTESQSRHDAANLDSGPHLALLNESVLGE